MDVRAKITKKKDLEKCMESYGLDSAAQYIGFMDTVISS
jgi:hypothetical protein